jgi:hypothetical protein
MDATATLGRQQLRRKRHERPIDPQQQHLRAYELPKLYPFSRAMFTKLLSTGAIPSYRIGTARIVLRGDVDRWFAERAEASR